MIPLAASGFLLLVQKFFGKERRKNVCMDTTFYLHAKVIHIFCEKILNVRAKCTIMNTEEN